MASPPYHSQSRQMRPLASPSNCNRWAPPGQVSLLSAQRSRPSPDESGDGLMFARLDSAAVARSVSLPRQGPGSRQSGVADYEPAPASALVRDSLDTSASPL